MTVLAACYSPSLGEMRTLTGRWVKSVLLGTEVGHARDSVVRWVRPVRYLFVDAPQRVRLAANSSFGQLQKTLAGAHRLELEYVERGDPRLGRSGYITVFSKAPRDARYLAQIHQVYEPASQADGWFTINWNEHFELTRAVVFVDPARDDRWLYHTVLGEMYQTLGPSNDSALVRDSLLFEGGNVAGSLDQLTQLDEQVLSLLYVELQPGDRLPDIAKAMQRTRWFTED